jgi:hypothetical protein
MAHGTTKYLNPSPTTAKSHMKWLHRGIRSTRCGLPTNTTQVPPTIPGTQIEQEFDTADINDNELDNSGLQDCSTSNANLIEPFTWLIYSSLPPLRTNKLDYYTLTSLAHFSLCPSKETSVSS